MRKAFSLAVLCVLVIVYTSCASVPLRKLNDEVEVLRTADNLAYAVCNRNVEKIWDLAAPQVKATILSSETKEQYLGNMRLFFEGIRATDYDWPKLVIGDTKYAVTQLEMRYEYEEKNKTHMFIGCERTFWLKFKYGWRWYRTTMSCSYMPSTEEIKRLTRDLR